MENQFIDSKHLQFYADKYGQYTNKLFSFEVRYKSEIIKILQHFYRNNNNFRAIYLKEKVGVNQFKVENSKELITLYNFFKISDIQRTDSVAICEKKYNEFKERFYQQI